jgi:hypothetical protein
MENLPKPNKGGRPRKIPRKTGNPMADALSERNPKDPGYAYARSTLAEAVHTDRTRANSFYAESATGYVEMLRDRTKKVLGSATPHDPLLVGKRLAGYGWMLERRTVLTELGRLADGVTPDAFQALTDVIDHVADRYDKLTAKAACAYVRGKRMGTTPRKERIAALHHDINAAINLHRQRHPESTWADIRRALDLSAGQIAHKAP